MDGIPRQTLDERRRSNNPVRIPGAGWDACLPKVVRAPGIHRAVFGDGEGVVRACCDVFDRRESDAGGREASRAVPLEDAARELGLLCCAPGEDGAGGGEGEDVVVSCCEGDDFGEVGHEEWCALEKELRVASSLAFKGRCGGEAEDPIVGLEFVSGG